MASGLVLSLAHPPADIGPLAFVALIPFLWAVREARARRGALLGIAFGAAYFTAVLAWLIPLTRLGLGVLVAGQTAWMALAFALVAAAWREHAPFRTALVLGAVWASVEWARGVFFFGGFTWGGLGYTQHDNSMILPLASVMGVWGISLAVMAINVLALEGLLRLRVAPRRAAIAVLVAGAVALLPAAIPVATPDGPPADVAVVQGNVPKFVAVGNRIIEDRIVAENHASVHVRMADDPPDLAVWPENSLDRDPTRAPDLRPLVEGAVRTVRSHTLAGAITDTPDGRILNQNLLYGPDGDVLERYTKNHLVPFGEYVPFREQLDFIEALEQVARDLTPGDQPGRFQIPAGRFSSVICFENSFPDLVRRFTDGDTGFIVVSTNNATFLRTPLSRQHLVLSELRAVENGRWVVHAAVSGISGIVDPRGRVVARTELFEPAILRRDIPQGSGRTVFNLIGGWLPGGFILVAGLGLLAPRRRRAQDVPPLPDRPRIAVVVPTYNERDTIEEVLRRVLAADDRAEIIVVDDSSPDGTGDVVRTVAGEDGRITLMVREGKQGLASAYGEGFRRALADGYDLVVEMDADLSHRPEELGRLLEAVRDHDVAIGSRYVEGGAIENWGPLRRLLSRGGNIYAQMVLGIPVADATSGYRVYRREALRDLLDGGITAEGYAFQVELAYTAWRRGFSVGEVPITFSDRTAGRSKLSRRIIVEALWKVLGWGIRDRLLRRGKK